MSTSLAVTGLLMGLAGGPHCVAMCGAACAGMAQSAARPDGRGRLPALWAFQGGRLLGYAALGALAAASVQGLGWLTVQSAALRPVWSMLHVAAIVLGLWLLLRGQQPVWLDQGARRVWQHLRGASQRAGWQAPALMGMLWAFMPCGLLYSALMVAALSAGAGQGALVMAGFALGSSVSLLAGPWLLLKMQALGDGRWGVRLAGLALAGLSGWALWMGLVHQQAPWCITPA